MRNRVMFLQKCSLPCRLLVTIKDKDTAEFIKEREAGGAGPTRV